MFPSLPPVLKDLLLKQEQRQIDHREALRARVASSITPIEDELAKELLLLNNRHFKEIMCGHVGYKLAQRRDSYRASLEIMETTFEDLFRAISEFEAAVINTETDLLSRSGDERRLRIERRVQKEMFAAANAAASLVDHSRRVNTCTSLPAYDAQRLEFFTNDGLHEFVIALRVLLHHLHSIRARWQIVQDFKEEKTTATFVFSREVLLRAMQENNDVSRKVRNYVAASEENIDVRAVFLLYQDRVHRFHSWMQTELNENPPIDLQEYDNLLRSKEKFDRQIFYRAMLGNWLNSKTPPDPHNHLHRYLSHEELNEVYCLPRNSKAQVDLVIKYGDRDGIVDDGIRQSLYHLFERAEGREPTG